MLHYDLRKVTSEGKSTKILEMGKAMQGRGVKKLYFKHVKAMKGDERGKNINVPLQ